MREIAITIDGQRISTVSDITIFRAAANAGIYIPGICDHPDLPSSGECGLCLVEIQGQNDYALSCTTKLEENMVVCTNTSELRGKQRQALSRILSQHPNACLTCWRRERCKPFDICLRDVAVTGRCVTCPKNGQCELQGVADFLDFEAESISYEYRCLPVNRESQFFDLDYNLCIACGRCVRACRDLRGVNALDFVKFNGYRVAGPKNGNHKESGCKFCFTCVEVCPTGAILDKKDKYHAIPDWESYVVPCRDACPAHIDIPRYVKLISEGKYSEALAVIREKVPFPGSLGRVCIHPCEQACRRGELSDPICIKFLKRYAADHDKGMWKQNSKTAPPTGKKVAIVGSGPAGLTAAYYLSKLGHEAMVFEALPQTGGMLRVGIPAYRLPKEILDAEIEEIKKVGVKIEINKRIESLDDLFTDGFDAIFIAIGDHKGSKIGVDGEELEGVLDGVHFLRAVALGQKSHIGKNVAIIGGGNSAIDCARVALRAGSKDVSIVYRRTRTEMPAAAEEVDAALHEGIKIIFLAAPKMITRTNGKLTLKCTKMELGEPDTSGRRRPVPIEGSEYTEEYDNIIAAIGQVADIPIKFDASVSRGNIIADQKTLKTSRKGVFAGGDVVTGPASVIGAIAQGRLVASSIDEFLGGKGVIEEILAPIEALEHRFGEDSNFADKQQFEMPELEAEKRLGSFTEVELGYSEQSAMQEAQRCLKCDYRLKLTKPLVPPTRVKTA